MIRLSAAILTLLIASTAADACHLRDRLSARRSGACAAPTMTAPAPQPAPPAKKVGAAPVQATITVAASAGCANGQCALPGVSRVRVRAVSR